MPQDEYAGDIDHTEGKLGPDIRTARAFGVSTKPAGMHSKTNSVAVRVDVRPDTASVTVTE